MHIVSLKDVSIADWIKFVETSDECWLYHHPEMQQLTDSSFCGFALIDHRQIVGLCILYVKDRLGVKVLSYQFGGAGIALNPAYHTSSSYQLIKQHLVQIARKNKCSAIYLMLPSSAPANVGQLFNKSHLHKLGFMEGIPWGNDTKSCASYTNIINLDEPLNKIFRGFNKSATNKCKQAAKLNLTYCISIEGDLMEWEHFRANHYATFNRSSGTPYSTEMLKKLKYLSTQGFVQLINFYEGEICAGSLLLLTYKGRAFYFASGTHLDYYAKGVPAYMHWIAIQYLAGLGYKTYELGQSFPALPHSKLYHIGQFKQSFGGNKFPILAGLCITSKIHYFMGFIIPQHIKNAIHPLWRRLSYV